MSFEARHFPAPWRARPVRSSRALVLLAALALHAALLLIPLRQPDAPAARGPVEIVFVQPGPPDSTLTEPIAVPEPVIADRQPAPAPDIVEPPATPAATQPGSTPAPQRSNFVITAAYLYDAAANLEWREPEAPHLTLGRSLRGELPRNLAQRILPWAPNGFDGMAAPSEVQVMDRWTEPDGSMMVVMRTPTGHTLCGRGQAWDPLNPLVENVMLFRTCGGGGKRLRPAP